MHGTIDLVQNIEVVGEPRRVYSSFFKGCETVPARIAG
jgi:hypothetical protein